MTERIDHAAEAVRISGLAHDNQNQGNFNTAAIQMQRAQMHATLAVAEQQRLANIIAWTTNGDHRPLGEVADLITEGIGL